MRFTVTWKSEAEERLARIWAESVNRQAITQAANQIDAELGRDPMIVGEARDGNERLVFVSPLAVVVRIQPDDCRVDVLSIRLIARDTPGSDVF